MENDNEYLTLQEIVDMLLAGYGISVPQAKVIEFPKRNGGAR